MSSPPAQRHRSWRDHRGRFGHRTRWVAHRVEIRRGAPPSRRLSEGEEHLETAGRIEAGVAGRQDMSKRCTGEGRMDWEAGWKMASAW